MGVKAYRVMSRECMLSVSESIDILPSSSEIILGLEKVVRQALMPSSARATREPELRLRGLSREHE